MPLRLANNYRDKHINMGSLLPRSQRCPVYRTDDLSGRHENASGRVHHRRIDPVTTED